MSKLSLRRRTRRNILSVVTVAFIVYSLSALSTLWSSDGEAAFDDPYELNDDMQTQKWTSNHIQQARNARNVMENYVNNESQSQVDGREGEALRRDMQELKNMLGQLMSELSTLKRRTKQTRDALQVPPLSSDIGDDHAHKEKEKREIAIEQEHPTSPESLFQEVVDYSKLDSSSAYCIGKNRTERMCQVKNLCYFAKNEAWVIIKEADTVIVNGDDWGRSKLDLDLVSIKDHNAFTFVYSEVPRSFLKDKDVRIVSKPAFMFMRFLPYNIMHAIHDDALPLYYSMKEFAPKGALRDESGTPFSTDNVIAFMDGHGYVESTKLFKLFTENRILTKEDWGTKDKVTCFANAVIGTSRQTTWYQYGFGKSQGPIANKYVDGHGIKPIVDFIVTRLGYKLPDPNHLKATMIPIAQGEVRPKQEDRCIVIFSRTRDRLIKNEKDLAAALTKRFGLTTKFVRMEDTTFPEQVAILQTAAVAIGMHGSILILGLFLPPGAILVEMYPYAIPAENYTPYRTMGNMPGLYLTYRHWVNTRVENNIPHAEYDTAHGGLAQFSLTKQRKIKETLTVPKHVCCSDPYWLFRIYQDTIVDIDAIAQLVEDALPEAHEKLAKFTKNENVVMPSPITGLRCDPKVRADGSASLGLSWNRPWNQGIVDKYSLWEHHTYKEYFSTDPRFDFPCTHGKAYEFWVRPIRKTQAGDYSGSVQCTCP